MMRPTPRYDSLFFIYGPPGSGKSTVGKRIGAALELPFIDLDQAIEAAAGQTIPAIFSSEGEAGFRAIEQKTLREQAGSGRAVIALGGGALLSEENRSFVEAQGKVLCLSSSLDKLVARLQAEANARPLLGGGPGWEQRLKDLLDRRSAHYSSFPIILDTTDQSPEEAAWFAQVALGAFRVNGMKIPYDVRVIPNGLSMLGELLSSRNLKGPIGLVADTNTMPIYGPAVKDSLEQAGYKVISVQIPSGEDHKNIANVCEMWATFLAGGLERSSTVVALGGGVTGDLSGFAAATYLRGIRWVAVPTTLLSMVDASLGGKTGFDLPQGKNLVGAFHPPSLVLADPKVLKTLSEGEIRSGMAEVIKHGIIADSDLFNLTSGGWTAVRGPDPAQPNWDQTVRRAIAVKVRVIQIDPFEQGVRASLNLGHTIGHAIEAASNYRIRHGEAVAIGTVTITRIAEDQGLCEPGLTERIKATFANLGLPTDIPTGLDPNIFITAIKADKKKSAGIVRYAIPIKIGEVKTGIALDIDLPALLPEAK